MKVLPLDEGVSMKHFGCEYLKQLSLHGVGHFVSLLPNGLGVWKDAGTGEWQLVHSVDMKVMRDRSGDGGGTHSLTHSLTYLLTYSLTHSLKRFIFVTLR